MQIWVSKQVRNVGLGGKSKAKISFRAGFHPNEVSGTERAHKNVGLEFHTPELLRTIINENIPKLNALTTLHALQPS